MNWRRGIWLTLEADAPQGSVTHWFRLWFAREDGRRLYFPDAICGVYSIRHQDDRRMAWPFEMPTGTVDADGPRCPRCEEAKDRPGKRKP